MTPDQTLESDLQQIKAVCGEPLDRQMDWFRHAARVNAETICALRKTIRAIVALVTGWPEVRQRALTVEDAALLGVCRICKGSHEDGPAPFVLNYGKEFAHERCLAVVCPFCGMTAGEAKP